jgi:hypothetical protein
VVIPGVETIDLSIYKSAVEDFAKKMGAKFYYQDRKVGKEEEFLGEKEELTQQELLNKAKKEKIVVLFDRSSRIGYDLRLPQELIDKEKTLFIQLIDKKIGWSNFCQYIRRNREKEAVSEELWIVGINEKIEKVLERNEEKEEADSVLKMDEDFTHQSIVNVFNFLLEISPDMKSKENIIQARQKFQSYSKLNDRFSFEFVDREFSQAVKDTIYKELSNFKEVFKKDSEFYKKLLSYQKEIVDDFIKKADQILKDGIELKGERPRLAKLIVEEIGYC